MEFIRKELENSLRALTNHAWEGEVLWPAMSAWINNFNGSFMDVEEERAHAMLSLTRYMYFSKKLVREMLRSLYRDHFESALKQRIRRNYGGTTDSSLIARVYQTELESTRFIGVGNPSESGAHLLYYFRQVNGLRKDLFCDFHAAFTPQRHVPRNGGRGEIVFSPRQPGVSRYVFFDDLVGSGTQVKEYLSRDLRHIRKSVPDIDLRFLSLFSTSHGLMSLNQRDFFNGQAATLFELDESYKAFEENSRYFKSAIPPWFDKEKMRGMVEYYGNRLIPGGAFGYKDGQLLLAFSHNTPDNAPPVYWFDQAISPWKSIFPRYSKAY